MAEKKRLKFIYILAAASLIVILLISCLYYHRYHQGKNHSTEQAPAAIALDEFGFPQGAFLIESKTVTSNQTLSHILAGFNISPVLINSVVDSITEIFNPRRIRAGQAYHGYFTNETEPRLQYIVYEISMLEYLKIGFDDTLTIGRHQKEVTTIEKTAGGIIYSSLWNTLTANNLSQELAIRLSEVLAWEVDFYRIQRGDRFKVVYQESFVGERSVGIPRIDAVYFVNQGREIYGFFFENDTVSGFFNPDGDNLRKVFLKAPLEFGRITSRYSHSRLHPVLKYRRPHHGTDYAAPHGTPILAVGDGVVTAAAYNSGNGNYVRIRHNSVYETQYLHMSRFGKGIRPGTRVTQGQVIGYVGATGLATGPHVCFRFSKNGQPVDHLREEFPSADPLHPDYHLQFFEIRDRFMKILEQIEFESEEAV